MATMMPLAKLLRNWDLYPRANVDKTQVRRMVVALRAGEEFPPLLCDRRTLTIIDGFHRYEAYLRELGEGGEVAVETRVFRDEAEMLLTSIELNARHGVPLEPLDRARVVLKAQDLGIAPARVAKALAVQVIDLESITAQRVVIGSDGLPEIAKRTLQPLIAKRPGMRFSKAQSEANARLAGMRPEYYLGRTLDLVKHRLLDLDNPRIVELLGELRDVLNSLGKKGALKKVAA
jgi:hypothetical protein